MTQKVKLLRVLNVEEELWQQLHRVGTDQEVQRLKAELNARIEYVMEERKESLKACAKRMIDLRVQLEALEKPKKERKGK